VFVFQSKTSPAGWRWINDNAGKPHDEEVVQKAGEEVEEFCRVLKFEGVTVHRPEPIRWDQMGTFRTPYFEEGGCVWHCALLWFPIGQSWLVLVRFGEKTAISVGFDFHFLPVL